MNPLDALLQLGRAYVYVTYLREVVMSTLPERDAATCESVQYLAVFRGLASVCNLILQISLIPLCSI